MVSSPAPPNRGDLVWLDFTRQAGHEQSGRRPALVLSPSDYNRKAGLLLACPITSRPKGYPFEVAIPEGLPIKGVILADHVRNLDWRSRRAEAAGHVGAGVMSEVVGRLAALLGAE